MFEILTLYQKCGALKVGNFVIGSNTSRFYQGSVVKVHINGTEKLCEIQYYARCVVKYQRKTSFIWLSAVSFFPEHQCNVWFGCPTEVWGGVTDMDINFVPVSSIQHRVAFAKSSVDFGQVIGTDNVVVASPLY